MSEMQAQTTDINAHGPITVAEYYRMGEAGIIGPDDRVELLDGDLIAMPPISPDHGYSVYRLDAIFQRLLAGRALVRVQAPVTLDDRSEPRPDLVLNALPAERYAESHPTGAESLLVVEVSKSSLGLDRGRKLRAYARGGVHEYWIVDLVHGRVDVYRQPAGQRYRLHLRAERGEAIACAAFPDDPVAVDDILVPPAR